MRLDNTPTRFGSRFPRVTSTTTTSTTTGTTGSNTNRNESGGGRRSDDHDGDDDEDDVTDDEHNDRVAATRASTTTNTTNYSSSSTTPLLSRSICFQTNSNRSHIDSLSLSRLHVQNNNNRVIATDDNDDWCSERHRTDAWDDTNGGDENIDDNNNIIICTNNNTIANTISSNNSYNSILLFRFRILFPWLYHNHQLGTPDDSTNDSLVAIVIGITTLIFIGSIIGTISYYSTTSPQQHQHSSSLSSHNDLVSSCIGYSYVIMWSVSFYPQCLLNRQRRTCTGLSIDFCWYNFVGFICYTTYNVALYFNPTIQRQYDARQPPQEDDHHYHSSASTTKIPIQANDVAFAVHALILCTILLFQVGYYDGISALRPSRQSSYILTVLLLCIVLYPIIFLVVVPTVTNAAVHHPTTYQILDYIFFLSYIKVCITCMKYVPQVYYNYHRRSTVGWNIWQILLDLFGGIFSTAQLIYDAPPFTSTSDVMFRNLPKFMLGNISIVFDIIFIVQHYYLYPTTTTAMTREEPFTGSLTQMDEQHNPIAYHFLNTSDEDETDADV